VKENRAPNTSWSLRRPGVYPNILVGTMEGDLIQIVNFRHPGFVGGSLLMSRSDARLLARRINQCLDETRRS